MTYPALVLADGASHYWRLNELTGLTAADLGKVPAPGTISGGVTLGAPGALTDGSTAMTFNGTSGQIALGAGVVVPVVATIEAWVQLSMPPVGYTTLFSSRGTGTGVMGDVTVGVTPAGLLACYSSNQAVVPPVFGTKPLALGARYHVAYVLDGATATLYVNSVVDNAGPFARSAPSSAPGYLGADHNNASLPGGQYWWAGVLDEVAIYPTALSVTQLQAHGTAARVPWPAKSWAPREFVTSQMMNDIRDQLNELHARVAVDLLTYVDIPFAASNFYYPSGASWTVTAAQVSFNRYWRLGKTVIWTFQLSNTVVGGATAASLYMVPPLPVARGYYNVRTTYDNSAGLLRGNTWTLVDPTTGNVLFQSPGQYQVGTFTGLCTMIYETSAP